MKNRERACLKSVFAWEKVAPMCVDALRVSSHHTAVCVSISAAAPVRHWLAGGWQLYQVTAVAQAQRNKSPSNCLAFEKATPRFKKQGESLTPFWQPIHLPSSTPFSPLSLSLSLSLSAAADNTLFRASDQGRIISSSPPSPLQLHLHNCRT